MKRAHFFYIVLVIMLMTSVLKVKAQLPDNAEDISPLLYGETIPDISLTTIDENKTTIKEIVKTKPTILLIYRGGWCPYCNTHLSEIQNIEDDIIALGYQIVAISPDSPENLSQTKEKLNYKLFSDSNGSLIKSLGIAFKAPEKYSVMLNKTSDGLNNGFLPVPSVFVVDNSGKIKFEYINPDYSNRISANLLLAVLKALKNE